MPVNMRGRTVDANGTVRLISQNFPDVGQANSFASRLISQYGISSTVQQSKNGGFFVVGMTGNTQNIQMYYNQQHDLFVFPDITYAPQINDYVPPAQAAPQAPPAAVRTQNTVQPAVQQIKGKTVVCKKCGATYSKSAKACPSCGAANKKPIYSRWWFWAIIGVLVLVIIIPKGTKDSENISDGGSNVNNSSAGNTAKDESLGDIVFDQLTAVDNDICSFVITDIDPKDTWGYTLKVLLENKTSDRNLVFSVTNASINGVNLDPLFASEVAAGKKSNNDINFSSSSIKEYGLSPVTDIELILRVYDDDDWSIDDYANTVVHIYPYGEEKAVQFVREDQAGDIILIDNEYVKAVVTGIDKDGFWGYTLNLYLINKTDSEVMFSADNVSINGFMADPYFASSVTAHRSKFTTISWSDSTLEENGITEVKNIDFTFKARDDEKWDSDYYAEENITITP